MFFRRSKLLDIANHDPSVHGFQDGNVRLDTSESREWGCQHRRLQHLVPFIKSDSVYHGSELDPRGNDSKCDVESIDEIVSKSHTMGPYFCVIY